MTISRDKLLEGMTAVKYNPSAIQNLALNYLSDEGFDVVDPTSPFVFLLEASATMAASAMLDSRTNTRLQYAYSASQAKEVYPHMADKDLRDIFALPSSASFVIGFEKQELIDKMVMDTDGVRKVVIPRNTFITISGTTFSLQYPIEIRQMSHKGLQIVWNLEKTSPLKKLSTNVIEYQSYRVEADKELIIFKIEMDQFSIQSRMETVGRAEQFSMNLTVTDQYYFARVYFELGDKSWREIAVTYTDEIYDVKKPTAIIRVSGKDVNVQLPLIYTRSGGLQGRVRVDIYETKGPIALDLGAFNATQYAATWLAIDVNEQDKFVAPLKSMQTTYITSADMTTGGKQPMSFDSLRMRMISNAMGDPVIPITPAQIQGSMDIDGYTIVKHVDHQTNRTYLATRQMPAPQDIELITAASAGIHTLTDTVERLSASRYTYQNGESITISPNMLYRLNNGLLTTVPDAVRDAIDAMDGDKKSLAITDGGFFYSPFHYVLDTQNQSFDARAYYLDSPEIKARTFIAENDKTLLQVSVAEVNVERTDYGYRLLVLTTSSQEYKDIADKNLYVNLGFRPDRTGDFAYIPGTLVSKNKAGERLWSFEIRTNHNLTSLDKMEVTNAFMYDTSPIVTAMDLLETFDLFFSTNAPLPDAWAPASFDQNIGLFLVPNGTAGITNEQVKIQLGHALTNLWRRGRSVAGEEDYERWAMDVPAIYERDVYLPYPDGATFRVIDGEVVFNIIHKKGEMQKDSDGKQIYKHLKGDVKLDQFNRPTVLRTRQLKRQIDLFLIEAAYYFASNTAAVRYRSSLVKTVVNWVTNDLAEIAKQGMENTMFFFYPRQMVGRVNVIYGPGLKTTIDAGQSFQLTLYVTDAVYRNTELKEKLKQKSIRVIGDQLTKKTVAVNKIMDALGEAYQNDVIALDASKLGGPSQLTALTMLNDSERLSIRKKLIYREDGSFELKEDVTVEFVLHERTDVQL